MSAPQTLLDKRRGLNELVAFADFLRLQVSPLLDAHQRATLGQFFTPAETARLMASMFLPRTGDITVLDAGAGVGSLSAAFVAASLTWSPTPKTISIVAYEIDTALCPRLETVLNACRAACESKGVSFERRIEQRDFVAAGASVGEFFGPDEFDYAILNPPYRKVRSDSRTRQVLRTVGVETTNLYSAFVSLAIRMLKSGGELVAITPRSFCNGPYFRRFRRQLLADMSLCRVHVFESRDRAFRDDEVLQENVILHAAKEQQSSKVVISTSSTPDDIGTTRTVPFDRVIRPDDPEAFIHVVPDEYGSEVAERIRNLSCTLSDLGISVSTGRVVDFRAIPYLRAEPLDGTAPLIYPGHLNAGGVEWPKQVGKKPIAIVDSKDTDSLLLPSDLYVVVKRFSAKEERRRLVAAVFDPAQVKCTRVGFENHLNYFHISGGGLPKRLARGLVAFLNSTLADEYFRQFNGHTQVNATDLRNMRYPSREQLEALGARISGQFPSSQPAIDTLIEEGLFLVTQKKDGREPAEVSIRIKEALGVLRSLGLTREQENERSALTLLALLDLKPSSKWIDAKAPLIGVTPIMEYAALHYFREYAPNSRETFRRQTLHQFEAAGLIVANPDKPTRAINSPDYCYQVAPEALAVLRAFGTSAWDRALTTYQAQAGTLKAKYAAVREMVRIPLSLATGKTITLSPGGQNELVKKIVSDFCERFTAGAKPVYVGDTDKKFAYFDEGLLAALGVKVDAHGKMPDVVVFLEDRNWLVLIEAVTSHGPVSPKRREELDSLFKGAKAGLVFVTAFLTRKDMVKYLADIAWETEVWVAETPTHMIHFNGERFLGPYETSEGEK